VGCETFGKPLGQLDGIDQRAELVTRLVRQQAAGELERVEHLGALPATELVLQDTNIDVRIVGDQRVSVQGPQHLVPEGREHRGN